MAAFTFPAAVVLIQGTALPAPGATGVLRPFAGADAVPVYDLNDSPLASVRVGEFGVHQEFKADIPNGLLDFGSVLLSTVSREALAAGLDAADAAQDAQIAAQDAQMSADAARVASLGKADAQHSHGVTDITASGARDSTTFLRGDGSWAVPPQSIGGGGNVIGDGITTIKKITQSAYDALTTKDPATLYVRTAG